MKRIQGGRSLALRASSAAVVTVVAMGGLAASAQALEIKVPGVATVGVGENDKVADVKLGSGSSSKSTLVDIPLGDTKVHVGTGGDSTADVTVGSDGGTNTTPSDGKNGKNGRNGKPGVIRIIRGGNGQDGKDGKDARGTTTTKGSGTVTITRTVGASTTAETSTGKDTAKTAKTTPAADNSTDSNTTADDLTSSNGHSWWFWALWSLLALLAAGAIGWFAAGRRRREDEKAVPADDNETFLASLDADERNEQGAGTR